MFHRSGTIGSLVLAEVLTLFTLADGDYVKL
jgi:hypothetical protein